jgi:hypothetical protein
VSSVASVVRKLRYLDSLALNQQSTIDNQQST